MHSLTAKTTFKVNKSRSISYFASLIGGDGDHSVADMGHVQVVDAHRVGIPRERRLQELSLRVKDPFRYLSDLLIIIMLLITRNRPV